MRRNPEKPFIVPVFIPHSGCPHQCVFCNQNAITGVQSRKVTAADLPAIINAFLKFKGPGRRSVEISFYGGTFLGLDKEEITALLTAAARFVDSGVVDGIRFSTRPDTIDIETLDLLKAFPVSTIELGVQSMDDTVLRLAGRGHTVCDTETAVHLLKQRDYRIGLQLMIGLPGDTEFSAMASAREIAALAPDFVRIYPTVVLNASPLAHLYASKCYTPLSLDQAVKWVKNLYLFFQHRHIPVIRMGLQPSTELEEGTDILAGPYHPAFGYLVFSSIFLDMAVSLILRLSSFPSRSGFDGTHERHLVIYVHPRSISEMRGLRNQNIKLIKDQFHFTAIDVAGDKSLDEDAVRIGDIINNSRNPASYGMKFPGL